MSKSNEEMKYLAMRAKKMTARLPDIPSPEALQARFKQKGTEVTIGEARELVVAVEKHRADMGIPVTSTRSAQASSKPEPKDELRELADRVTKLEGSVTVNAPAMKTVSRSHGR